MADVAVFDQAASPQRVTEVLLSVNTPDHLGLPDRVVITRAVAEQVLAAPRYWKHVAGVIVAMTQGEQDALDAAETAARLAILRAAAKAAMQELNELALSTRALALATLDEINGLRTWTRDFKSATAAATNLANLQSRVAALPTLADRTEQQLKTVIDAAIDGLGG